MILRVFIDETLNHMVEKKKRERMAVLCLQKIVYKKIKRKRMRKKNP